MLDLKKNILLIDNSRPIKSGSVGGSINSLIQLIAMINKNKFNIYLLLYYKIPVIERKLKKLEIKIIYKYENLTIKRNQTKKKISRLLPFFFDLSLLLELRGIKIRLKEIYSICLLTSNYGELNPFASFIKFS